MTEDHRTVLHSIAATLVVALIVLVATVLVSGGFSMDLVRQWVLPLIVSAMVLGVFWIFVYRNYKRTAPVSSTTPAPVE